MYKLICIFLLTLTPLFAISQTINEVDSVTYSLYLNQEWDELIKYSQQAINTGIDFYYLRMRTGIAEYTLKDFISSIPHFEKALDFNKGDQTAIEYLYFGNLLSGRNFQAGEWKEKLSSKRREELGILKENIFNYVYSESGYTTNTNFENLRNSNHSENLIYDEDKYIRDQNYFNISLGLKPMQKLILGVSYNKNIINTVTRISELIDSTRSFDNKTNLDEIYISVAYYLGNGFTISPAYHYLSGDAEYTNFRYVQGTQGLEPEYTTLKADIKDHVFSLAMNKFEGKFNLDMSGSVSDLNNRTVYQAKFLITFFPLGNLDLYFTSNLSYINDKAEENHNRFIFEPKAGVKISNRLWGEIYYTLGNYSNYNESNAFTVYNNPEKIENRLGVNFISPIIERKLTLSLRMQLYDQYTYSLRYTDFTNYILSDNKNKLLKLIGGIQWTI